LWTQESANRIASTRNLTGLPSIHMGERPLPTSFNPETGEARATLDRDLDAGRHLATVIVVHDSGRLHPEAIIFTTTAS